jgi:hypothetical protein
MRGRRRTAAVNEALDRRRLSLLTSVRSVRMPPYGHIRDAETCRFAGSRPSDRPLVGLLAKAT